MRMRWCFTMKDNGTAKAQIVLLGFQDHRLGTIATASPAVSERERNLALQACDNLGLKLGKGDVKAGFRVSLESERGLGGTSPSHGTAQQRHRTTPQESIRAMRCAD